MGQLNKLIEIPTEELPFLKDVFKANWPQHIIGYYTIDNYYKWLQQTPVIPNFKIYSLNGEWNKDGLYIIIDRYDLFIYSIQENNIRLREALKLLDWSKGYKISCFADKNLSDIKKVLTNLNLNIDFHYSFDLFYLPKEKGIELKSCPSIKYNFQPLEPNNYSTVNKYWTFKHKSSEFFISRLIERNPSVGAFSTETGELMGWMLNLTTGSHVLLQVKPEFQKRGIGKSLAKYLTHKRAQLGMDSFCLVHESNAHSQILFKKLGYQKISKANYIRIIGPVLLNWED